MNKSIVGQLAPNFTLQSVDGSIFDSRSLQGQWRVIFFYSTNNSPVCKRGCLTFKEQHELFASSGCSIIGIGPGSIEKVKEFQSDVGDLPFPLLADKNGQIAKSYQALISLGFIKLAKRHTFIIDPNGIIQKIYRKVNVSSHSDLILADLKTLQSN